MAPEFEGYAARSDDDLRAHALGKLDIFDACLQGIDQNRLGRCR